jgi:hypothetical protein
MFGEDLEERKPLLSLGAHDIVTLVHQEWIRAYG